MAEKRRLQNEVDRTLKKIDEGIQSFELTLTKFQNTHNQSQKEKLGEELKKEIKKLQRHRDHLKQWQSGNDVKDKEKLASYRHKIEVQMEIFKNVERESKSKNFGSGKGDSKSLAALDPEEKERLETREELETCLEKLIEQLSSTKTSMDLVRTGNNLPANENDEEDDSNKKSTIVSRKDRRRNKKEKRSQSAVAKKEDKSDTSSVTGSNHKDNNSLNGIKINPNDLIPVENLDPELAEQYEDLLELKECVDFHIVHVKALVRMLDNGSITAEQINNEDIINSVDEFIIKSKDKDLDKNYTIHNNQDLFTKVVVRGLGSGLVVVFFLIFLFKTWIFEVL